MANNFKNYQVNSLERQPREQLVSFINQHQEEIKNGSIKNVVDLGCGGCVDSKYLASLGLNVLAVDKNMHSEVIEYVEKSTPQKDFQNITFSNQGFENLNLPKTDLLWSFASMPFCQKENFAQMMANAISAIYPNGYFFAHFFDKTHPFITEGGNVGVDKTQMQQLFNYLGFNAEISTFKSERTADGHYTENLNNVFVVAQAPEQLKEFSVDEISEILGLTTQQQNNDSQLMQESQTGETIADSENISNDFSSYAPSQPDWMNNVSDSIKEKLSPAPQQEAEPQPAPPCPPPSMEA